MQEITPEMQPDLVPTDNFGNYVLRRAYTYLDVIIPVGYEYGCNSIPHYLVKANDLHPDGLHRAAFLVHDYLYHVQGCLGLITRKLVDKNLRTMLLASGVGRTRSNHIYENCVKFGWIFWNRLNCQHVGLCPRTTSYAEMMQYMKHFLDNGGTIE